VIKGCEFHLQNFLRKGRPKVTFSSLDELVTSSGETLGELLEDKKETFSLRIGDKLTIEEIKNIDLTEREKSTLSYLLKGYTIREIAQELGVSHVMVLKYKKGILKKWRKKR
jgi:DNA-binding NarL/FixJ family response regulator